MAKAEQPSNFHRVAEFHRAFSLPVEPQPVVPDDATIRLRLALLLEEFHELAEATCQQPDADQQTFLDTLATNFSNVGFTARQIYLQWQRSYF